MRPGLVQREEWEWEAWDRAGLPGLAWTCSLKSLAMTHLCPSPAPYKKVLCPLSAPQRGGSPASAVGQSQQHLCIFARGSAVSPGKSGGVGKEEQGDKGVRQRAQTAKKK